VSLKRSHVGVMVFVALALSLFMSSRASAELTVRGKYTLISGDTLIRDTYYSTKRVRVTLPDGREMVYDKSADRVMVINHANKTYWRGRYGEADSLATKMLYEHNAKIKAQVEANQERWGEIIQNFNDSLNVTKTEEMRDIAGYPCTKWVLRAGPYMMHERWVARALDVANYGPELEKLIAALTFDPLGRVLMRQLVQLHAQDGLPLSASTTYKTLTQQGSFSWEARSVTSHAIPDSIWQAPPGYRRIQP
jgi:Domain of unknown function (DUF4412)